jgi:hypothetical protein
LIDYPEHLIKQWNTPYKAPYKTIKHTKQNDGTHHRKHHTKRWPTPYKAPYKTIEHTIGITIQNNITTQILIVIFVSLKIVQEQFLMILVNMNKRHPLG